MPVIAGGSVQNEEYNNLRSTISGIYSSIWTQTMRSSAVTGGATFGVSDSIASLQLLNLYLDLQSVHVHQTGTVSSSIAVPQTGYTVGADTSFNFNTSTGVKTAVVGGTAMGHNDFDSVVTTISNYTPAHLSFPAGNFSPSAALSNTRTTSWGTPADLPTQIEHELTVTFASATARAAYFNAGGRLTFNTSASTLGTGVSLSKNTDWQNLLVALGTCYFDKFATSASSGTTVANNGLDGLNGTYKTLWTKIGSGVYADNSWYIQGRTDSTTVLRFRIRLNDGDTGTGNQGGPGTGTPIDEPVTADITNSVVALRPDSTFTYNAASYTACSLPNPTLTTITTFQ